MRYIIGFILSIVLLIFAFVLIFRGGSDNPATTPQTPSTIKPLIDYANTDIAMRVSIDYPVSADQTHAQIVMTVSRDVSTVEVYRGYEGQLLRTQSYPNNEAAYANFLKALQFARFTRGVDDPKLKDERGYCATGKRYIYEIKDNDRSIQRLWSTSCSAELGTFKGKGSSVRALFVKQLPDYNKVTSSLPH